MKTFVSGNSQSIKDLFPIEKSGYYQHWLLEQEQISLNWERLNKEVGHDVGKEHARWDWIMRRKTQWLQSLRK